MIYLPIMQKAIDGKRSQGTYQEAKITVLRRNNTETILFIERKIYIYIFLI